ncbi:DUF11 domain-containing protein [Methanothrix harundinacea]|jgi:uncharacterized repeat protein (TIGR01451 family)|uniref:Conserved repeat domain protein n=1 Tax=Methanothrix harundinacea (strain 6Ac) TaxID=1110509 RepID=G7WKD3_METH6|nr:DUF11 domain-containing protein [Methanothrix harundinacea]AET64760.1 Conserved repeat domain protein [Methanothrix harundinacea 6Ac]
MIELKYTFSISIFYHARSNIKRELKLILFMLLLASIFFISATSAQGEASVSIMKIASATSVSPGEPLYYAIFYENDGDTDLTGVDITESYPPGTEFVQASIDPKPGTVNVWEIGDLSPGEGGVIGIGVMVHDIQDLEFSEEGRVVGEGFVSVRDSLSTSPVGHNLKNVATIDSDQTAPVNASVSVAISNTKLDIMEHGSGTYESDEKLKLRTENTSISMEKDGSSGYKSTSIHLYNNRTVNYSSKWTQIASAENWATGASMSESYRYATSIDRKSRMFLDENESVMNIESVFNGTGHIGFLKMPFDTSTSSNGPAPSPPPTPQALPLFESREDYFGSFRILQIVDEYGSSVTSDKYVSGTGRVAVNKGIGSNQSSYESGTGTYDSEEMIRTYTNYISKDISLVHAPMSQSLTDDVSIESSMRWKEGMYSRSPGGSYIGEEYTSADYLYKSAVAAGLNNTETIANFSGRARYRAILRDSLDFDELYEGNHLIERRINLYVSAPKYNLPHLNVTTTLEWIDEETIGVNETIATYTISIENDGDRALAPVYVRDIFPPGSVFIHPASVRPTELNDKYANWTLTHLGIGDVATIIFSLEVTKALHVESLTHHPAELVNRVEACGGYNGSEWICGSNGVSVVKTAQLDPQNGSIVWYKIYVNNDANSDRAATVTDQLPEGMKLLDPTFPASSEDNGTITWNLEDIEPFDTETITYSVEALHAGRFVNVVRVDPKSLDGLPEHPVYATAVIDIEQVDKERIGSTWRPPNWDFEYVGYSEETTCDEICSMSQ